MSETFVVQIGGFYLDSKGNISFTAPPPDAQIYRAPHGLHLDPPMVQHAVKELTELLPHSADAKHMWESWGISHDVVDYLHKISTVMGAVTTVLTLVNWTYGAAMAMMKLVGGSQGLSPDAAKAFNTLTNLIRAHEQIDLVKHMVNLHSKFDGPIDRISTILTNINVGQYTGADRAAVHRQMRQVMDDLAQPLAEVRKQDWAISYDPDRHQGRVYAHGLLVFERGDGKAASVPMHAASVTVFDYRLGVPMLLYAGTTFAALAKITVPWFRSAGLYAHQFRQLADDVDAFVLRMQKECLTRTNYDEQTVMSQLTYPILQVPSGGGPQPLPFARSFAAGAFDLPAYSDGFLLAQWREHVAAGRDISQRGMFDYHHEVPQSLLTQPLLKTADYLNDLSRRSYADLQAATGLLRLVQFAAWLRFNSTPPLSSQTISGKSSDSRRLIGSVQTKVTSPASLPSQPIESLATLNRYEAGCRIRVKTQEPGYDPRSWYRIVLRTIDNRVPNASGGWAGRDYVGDVWSAEYQPTANDPRCQRLVSDIRKHRILHERVLFEGTATPERRSVMDGATVPAATFDWFVPVEEPGSVYSDGLRPGLISEIVSELAGGGGKGGKSYHLTPPGTVMDGPSPLAKHNVNAELEFDGIDVLQAVSMAKAERRNVKVEDVQLDWSLAWQGDALEVRVYGRPEQRPFQVHIVIEERVYSGESLPEDISDIMADESLIEYLHTPFEGEVVNQLILVPDEFFAREAEALKRNNMMWSDFIRRFSESAPISPGEPIEGLHRDIVELVTASASTATLAQIAQMRADFAAEHAPQIWAEVSREGSSEA